MVSDKQIRAIMDNMRRQEEYVNGGKHFKNNQDVKKLCKEVQTLQTYVQSMRSEISFLTDAVTNIKQLLKQNSTGLSQLLPEIDFPLKSEEDLRKINRQIKPGNRLSYISKMKELLEKAVLSKSIKLIMNKEIIVDHNIEGVRKKKSLKIYKSFLSALLDAIKLLDQRQPADILLRKAMLCVKNSVNKMKNKLKKTQSQNFEVVYDDNTDDSESFNELEF